MTSFPSSKQALLLDMEACEQTRGQSVLDHGNAVWATFQAIHAHLSAGGPEESWWRLPRWMAPNADLVISGLPSMEIMREYLVHHDCGKPYCLEVDAEGRRHFPGHAEVSRDVWLHLGGSPEAAELMALDMEAHLLRAEGIAEFAARPQATTLLLSAVAEVHANAAMFGGTDSDSFKIKAKNLDKRGGQVINQILKDHSHEHTAPNR